ncbi:AI-2E family transporter [Novosphingobium sp. PS1R-30]|uniref:AI-2E family transporter n=1 Tax=Novosphingobium anseongense TaxID=3133436 RepID=A0ABU8RQ94_9SPHN|nr:MAG: AI-2E family transporter [Novosphingobium sp.]
MSDSDLRKMRFEDGGFLVLVLLVTLAFIWLLMPYFGAVLWGVVAAIVFAPVQQMLVRRMHGQRNFAAASTLMLILALVIVPAIFIGISLVQEAAALYAKFQSGEINLAAVFTDLRDALPYWARRWLDSRGLADFEGVQRLVGQGITTGLQTIAARALLFGQGALSFIAALGVMLYLTYFLLRDGKEMGGKIKAAVPLRPQLRDTLFQHFVVVVRATVKGTVVVAIIQGFLGGVIFWMLGVEGALLWGMIMGFFSLVPAVGTAIVWVPVALFLLVTGSIWQGAVLVFCGVFIIGMVDNLLRPILVGQDTRMPDFLVLIATLAGIELFGLNGFIVGPVIAALFLAVWNIIAEERGAELPLPTGTSSGT